MSANLDLNSDVVSDGPEPTAKLGLFDAETLTDPTQEPVMLVVEKDQVKDFEGGIAIDGLGNANVESDDRRVETEIRGSVGTETERNTIVDVSFEVVQVTETHFCGVEDKRSCQIQKEVLEKEIRPSSAEFNFLPSIVKDANTDDVLRPEDATRVSGGVVSDFMGNQTVEDDDQHDAFHGPMAASVVSDAGISQENGDSNKSSALDLFVDLNPYVIADENESGGENVKVSASKPEFTVSDLVWGKVRSHPWWPGQILDPSDSSELAKKYFKRDGFLIAYFGDQTFAWNEASMIKPFRSHYSQMEKQNNLDEFLYAIECALDEVSRRVQFGLACLCIPEYSKISTQIIINTGIQEDASRRKSLDSFSSADAFEPAKLIDYIKAIGQLLFSVVDRLKFVTAKAQLSAFNHWKGYSQLPEFQNFGTLLLSDTEVLQSESAEVKSDGQLNENVDTEIRNDEHASSRKVKSKSQDQLTHKRKNISGDSIYPRKKEKSLAELLAERHLSVPNHKSGLGIKTAGKLTSSSSCKKREVVDSILDDFIVKRCKSLSSSGNKTNSSQSKIIYRVGESILRVASQLNGPTSMCKSVNDASQESATKDKSKEIFLSRNSQGKKLFQSEDSSSYEMLSQLGLAAKDPMKECSFLNCVVNFFVEFRNSICLRCANSPQCKQSFLDCVFGENIRKESSQPETEAYESEHKQGSCSTDLMIQSVPHEFPSLANQNQAGDIPSETATQTAQSSPNLDSEKQGAGEIFDMEATEPVCHLEDNCNDDHCPTALILNFTNLNSIPSETNLNKIFSRFGRVKESKTEVLRKSNRAKVVFYQRDDAEAAFSSAGKYSIFGPSLVSYRLKYMPSAPSKSPLNTTKLSKKNANSVEGNTT